VLKAGSDNPNLSWIKGGMLSRLCGACSWRRMLNLIWASLCLQSCYFIAWRLWSWDASQTRTHRQWMTRKLYVLTFIYAVTWDHYLSRITDPKNNHFMRVLFLVLISSSMSTRWE